MELNVVEIYGYSIVTLPVIVAMVYGIVGFLKVFLFSEKEKFKKYIPIVAAVLGGAIGVSAFLIAPETMPAANWYGSIVVGVASGLSAVGVHQIKKQAKKDGDGDAD